MQINASPIPPPSYFTFATWALIAIPFVCFARSFSRDGLECMKQPRIEILAFPGDTAMAVRNSNTENKGPRRPSRSSRLAPKFYHTRYLHVPLRHREPQHSFPKHKPQRNKNTNALFKSICHFSDPPRHHRHHYPSLVECHQTSPLHPSYRPHSRS